MSRGNVEIWRANVEAQLAALDAGADPEATVDIMAEIWDTEVELDATDAVAPDLNGTYLGLDEVRGFWQAWFSAWETVRFDYEFVEAGDRVAMLVDMQMRGRASGVDIPLGRFAWVGTFRDGLVVHAKFYPRQSAALEALGAAR